MNIALVVIACLLLVALAGLMAATEAALTVMSVESIRDEARTRKTQRSLTAVARDLRTHRNTATFVRIVSEMVVAVLVTGSLVMTALPLWAGLLIAVVIMVGVSFILAGSSPRSVGRAHPQSVLATAAPIIHGLRVVLGPLADALVTLGDKVTPGRPGGAAFASEEQLLNMVDEAARHEILEKDERELIHSVFEWGDTVAREVMVPRVDMVTVSASDSVENASRIFHERGFSRMPVEGDDPDDILGVLMLRDVSRKMMDAKYDATTAPVSTLMRPALFLPDSKKADEAMRELQSAQTHLALLVDEHGGIAGLVTMEDLIEELVGEISDEHDRGLAEVVKLAPHSYEVSARLHVEDLGDLFGIELEDEDIDSAGGLLAKHLDRIAAVGDSATVDGLVLTAIASEARGGRVTRIHVTRDAALANVQDAFDAEES